MSPNKQLQTALSRPRLLHVQEQLRKPGFGMGTSRTCTSWAAIHELTIWPGPSTSSRSLAKPSEARRLFAHDLPRSRPNHKLGRKPSLGSASRVTTPQEKALISGPLTPMLGSLAPSAGRSSRTPSR